MRLSQSPLTLGLLSINVILFIAMLFPSVNQAFLVSGAFFPFRLLGGHAELIGAGEIISAWITPMSAAFLHGGLTHLLFNILMLILIGHIIERVLGWILINFMMAAAGPGMGMNIAIYSHIGGFIAGLILAKPLLLLRYRKA